MNMRARIGFLLCAVVLALTALAGLHRAVATEPGSTHTVVMEGMKFSPAVVRIRPGDRVAFFNKDLFPHTATASGGRVFDSGAIKPGESWMVQPQGGNTIDYACAFHPTMTGRIIMESR